ncbi:hypothetical protein MsAm2_00700 [Methanolapillus ohkumae]|uniref:Uncharacterized protein n=1 Tax=Methanolapillus ohkumae TaxID=3028298 RepID=A0AA96V6B8_9EURY|nr:hypothetical protein MsAm2_00700 [Methanosarcinaceae archaeon Am2]
MYDSDGDIIGYGQHYEGYITVLINRDYGKEIDPNDFETIKSIFDQYGLEENISDVPIVFKSATIPIIYPKTLRNVIRFKITDWLFSKDIEPHEHEIFQFLYWEKLWN